LKNLIYFLLLLVSFPTIGGIAIYRGISEDQKVKVTIGNFGEGMNQFLIEITGTESELNGRVILAKKGWQHKDDINRFYFSEVGFNRILIKNNGYKTRINGSNIVFLELIEKNKKTKVYFHKILPNTEANIKNLVNKYHKSQGLAESRVKSKSRISKSLKRLNHSCSTDIVLILDWNDFIKRREKGTPSVATNYIDSITALCEKDNDYKEAVKIIKTIEVAASKKTGMHSVSIKNDKLTITIDKNVPNIKDTSNQLILNVF
jgi:hypothetical protein